MMKTMTFSSQLKHVDDFFAFLRKMSKRYLIAQAIST